MTLNLFEKNNINIQNNDDLEYNMVVIEPEYDIYNIYPIDIDKSHLGWRMIMKNEYLKDNIIMVEYLIMILLLI